MRSAARSGARRLALVREKRLRDVAQRIRTPSIRGNLQRSFRGNIVAPERLPQRFNGRLERLTNDRTDLARQAGVQNELIVDVEKVGNASLLVLALRELRRVAPLRPPEFPRKLLDVRGRAMARNVHEHGFVRGRRDARHRADLRIGDLAFCEGVGDLG